MRNRIFVLSLFVFTLLSSCNTAQNKLNSDLIIIKTEFGDITVKLYDETPQHKANFLKLVDEKFYDDVLFHRVIKNFMIQAGDPDSRNAKPDQSLGHGDVGYTIPAEINYQNAFHKRGALAAARQPDNVNPKKASSGAQFYIVQGRKLTESQLTQLEQMRNNKLKNTLMKKMIKKSKDELDALRKAEDIDGYNLKMVAFESKVDSIMEAENKLFKYSDEQREVYSSIGGAPHLDNEYTVFGEVVSGMDVVDKIAAVEVNKMNRPIKDIPIKVTRK